ncbi:unnamed protein product [Phytophthora fragariaefolia]|uniref:Unnamed protein product n=1 Tax=Phytophthora fragariaefolia TaxID=1490495 RepID=A0A9W6XC07_9STRA|nr:unnamed protein product [Phytophthora fragariaefolia]
MLFKRYFTAYQKTWLATIDLTTAGDRHGGAQDDGDQRQEGGQAAQEVRGQQGERGERGPHGACSWSEESAAQSLTTLLWCAADKRRGQVPVGTGAGAPGRQEAADPPERAAVRPVLGIDM